MDLKLHWPHDMSIIQRRKSICPVILITHWPFQATGREKKLLTGQIKCHSLVRFSSVQLSSVYCLIQCYWAGMNSSLSLFWRHLRISSDIKLLTTVLWSVVSNQVIISGERLEFLNVLFCSLSDGSPGQSTSIIFKRGPKSLWPISHKLMPVSHRNIPDGYRVNMSPVIQLYSVSWRDLWYTLSDRCSVWGSS